VRAVRDGVETGVGRGNDGPTIQGLSPADDGTVGFETKRVISPGLSIDFAFVSVRRNCGEIAVGLRNVELPPRVVSPPDDGAIGLESDAVIETSRHPDKTGVGHGDIELPVRIEAPADDRSIGLEAEAVAVAGGDGDETRIGRGHWACGPQRHDGPVSLQSET